MEHLPRRLPIVITPQTGEAFSSWITRYSLAAHTTPGLLVAALGAPVRPISSDSHPRWADILLTPAAASAITTATGLGAQALAGTHLSAFDGTLVDFTELDPAREPSLRGVAGRQWVLTGRSRACPQCLADTGGVWQTWWRLGLAGVCPTHSTVLADRCPGCARPLASGNRFPARFPAAPGWECGATWHGGSCAFDLRTIRRPDAPAGTASAQQRICGLHRDDTVGLAGVPLPASDYIREWRGVMNVMRGAEHVDGLDRWDPVVQQAWAGEANRLHTRTGATTRLLAPSSAALCAALLATTAQVMSATGRQQAQGAADTMVRRARGWPRRGGGTRWRDAESLTALGPPLRQARPRNVGLLNQGVAHNLVRQEMQTVQTIRQDNAFAQPQ